MASQLGQHLLVLWIITSVVCVPVLGEEGHDHDEVNELMEAVGKSLCGLPDHVAKFNQTCFQSVVTDYFKRFSWCKSTYKDCKLCKDADLKSVADKLFTMSNSAGSVTVEDMEKISVALVVLTHDIAQFCKGTAIPTTYADYLSDLTGESSFKENREEWLEHFFEEIGKKFDTTKNTKCATHQTIITESKAVKSDSAEAWAHKVTIFSVLHVLNGYQLDGACVNLPSQAAIMKSLLKALGLPSDTTKIPEDSIKKIMKELGIGNSTGSATTDSHGHAHRRKRSVEAHHRVRRAVAIQDMNKTTCLSVDNIFSIYGIDESVGISKTDLTNFCPALLEQKLSGACHKQVTKTRISDAEAYGFGFLAVALISLGSLLGLIFVPCMKKKSFDLIMLFSIGLAVGTLVCDSMLHLIPEAVGLHDHGHGGGFEPPKPYFWKFFVIVCVIYVFYLIELALSYWFSGMPHSHGHSHAGHVVELDVRGEDNKALDVGDEAVNGLRTGSQGSIKKPEEVDETQATSKVTNSRITAVFILGGDTIHNFADGLAIGAAFSGSISGGVSTSIAILCHELPHEIGDLAVLLSSNMSIKRALLFNFLSALSAILGFFIGVPTGSDEVARQWIFSFTAGIFLYISLTNTLTSIKSSCPGSKCSSFFTQAGGFLVGIFIITIIGIFESQIRV